MTEEAWQVMKDLVGKEIRRGQTRDNIFKDNPTRSDDGLERALERKRNHG